MIGGLVGCLGGIGVIADSLVDINKREKTPENKEAEIRYKEIRDDNQMGPIVRELNRKYLYLILSMPVAGLSFLTFYYGMLKDKYEKKIKQQEIHS